MRDNWREECYQREIGRRMLFRERLEGECYLERDGGGECYLERDGEENVIQREMGRRMLFRERRR